MAIYDDPEEEAAARERLRGVVTGPVKYKLGQYGPRVGTNPAEQWAKKNFNYKTRQDRRVDDLFNQEKATAAGRDLQAHRDKKAGVSPTPQSTRNQLSNEENQGGNWWNPKGSKKPQQKGLKGMKAKVKGRVAAAGLFAGLTGLGGGIGLFGVAAGPAQLLQAGNLLGNHLDLPGDQQESRLLSIVRYIRFLNKGVPQNSRLSLLGNKIADKAESRFNKLGITSAYSDFGNFRGYRVDPSKLRGGAFDGMPGEARNDPAKAAAWIQERYGFTVEVDANNPGRLIIDARQPGFTYRANKLFMRETLKASGAKGVTPGLGTRAAAKRAGMRSAFWHPIEALDRKTLLDIEDRYNAWVKKKNDTIEAGRSSVRPTVAGEEGANEETTARQAQQSGAIQETLNDAEAARSSPSKMLEFREKLRAKVATPFAVLGIIEIMCILMYIADNIDVINREHIDEKAQMVAADVMATKDQMQAAKDADLSQGGSEQIGFLVGQFNDGKVSPDSFFDALSIQRQNGHDGGVALPPDVKLGPADNWITQLFSIEALRESVKTACLITGSFLGIVVLGIIGVITVGPWGTAAGIVLGAVAIAGISYVISNILANKEIDYPGGLFNAFFGGVGDMGGFALANNYGMSIGGGPLTPAEATELKTLDYQLKTEEFQDKSLAYRLFNSGDPKSLAAQFLQQQKPDPGENVAMYASGLLNIGKTFGSLLSQPLRMASVGAAPIPHNYGVPAYGFTAAQMADLRFEMPFENAAEAVNLLEAQAAEPPPNNQPSYVERAKVCFGANLEKRPMADPSTPVGAGAVWGVSAPKDGEQPFYSTTESGHLPPSEGARSEIDFKCKDQGEGWMRIRFFIMDNMAITTYYCFDGDIDDPDTRQACIDAGYQEEGEDHASGGASIGGGPTCGPGGKAEAAAASIGYQLRGCEDFEDGLGQFGPYTGGGDGTVNGTYRTPSQCRAENGLLILTQQAGQGTCGGSMADNAFSGLHGYWNVRMKINGEKSDAHPVLITWPTNDDWPAGAEYDFVEVDVGDDCLAAVMHFPNHQPQRQLEAKQCPFNLNEFHDYGFEWLDNELIGYVDGKKWFHFDGQVAKAPGPMRLTIQLDNLGAGPPATPATMEVDWAHMYVK